MAAPPQREERGPSMFPPNWGRTLGLMYAPALIVLITIEQWLGVPQVAGWISLVGLFAGFLLVMLWIDRRST